MSIEIVEGDLVKMAKEGQFDAIGHGCNCFNAMGAGIAKTIATEFPGAYEADQKTKKGDMSKLGLFSKSLETKQGEYSFVLYNLYSQYHPGRVENQDTLLGMIYSSLSMAFNDCMLFYKDAPKVRFGLPMIGAGIAGGDWDVIYDYAILSASTFYNMTGRFDLTIVKFKP